MDKIAPAFEKPLITKNNQQKSIRIECRCKGKQEPKITWKKDKTELKDTPNKYKISKVKEADDVYLFILEILVRILFCFCLREREREKKIIYFQSVSQSDSGVYKILAKNDAGDSQALVNLTIDAEMAQA